jgi:hypothetical protein
LPIGCLEISVDEAEGKPQELKTAYDESASPRHLNHFLHNFVLKEAMTLLQESQDIYTSLPLCTVGKHEHDGGCCKAELGLIQPANTPASSTLLHVEARATKKVHFELSFFTPQSCQYTRPTLPPSGLSSTFVLLQLLLIPQLSDLEAKCHPLLQPKGGRPPETTRRNRRWQDYWDQVYSD